MVIASLNGIGKSYGAETILENVSFSINKGDRIGIIGVNGAGKTTLMNMIAGELTPDEGEIFISRDTEIGYLTQNSSFTSEQTVYEAMLDIFSDLREMEAETERLTEEISRISESEAAGSGEAEKQLASLVKRIDVLQEAYKDRGGFTYKSEISGILSSLAFPQSFFDKKASTLSGGEKTRLALAALLLRKPDLLLLDEPTNHLDIGTLNWLEQYVRSYRGTVLMISHDRYFLDHTVNRILDVENRKVTAYDGTYTQFAEKKEMLYEVRLREYEKQQTEIKRQEDLIRRYKERGTEKLAKRAKSREKMLEHMETVEKPVQLNGKIKIKFKDAAKSGNDVLKGVELSKSFGTGESRRLLFENVEFDIKRGERICIVGANGIGKTTLLNIMMTKMSPATGHVKVGHNVEFGYYDQEQQLLTQSETVLGELHNAYRLYDATELRGLLGRFLFKNDDVFKYVKDLSGGEKARLSLLKLMLSGANVLMMDEPTNHLDISSKEVFEQAITSFPGTVIIVSHDRYLLNRVPTRIWELSSSGITDYPGNYDYYLEKKSSLEASGKYMDSLSKSAKNEGELKALLSGAGMSGASGEGGVSDSTPGSKEERRRSKEEQTAKRRLEREKAKLEEKIAELETKIEEIETLMCSEEFMNDHVKLTEMAGEAERLKAELEETYDSWMELSEE